MLNRIALAAEQMPFGERASIAGVVTLQGMLTIFMVLAVLWACIEIMHAIVHRGEENPEKAPAPARKEKRAAKNAPAPNAEDAAIAAAIAAALAAEEDCGATVAAITAAITAALQEDGCSGAFRVVSFKRAGNAPRKRI